MPFKYTRQDLGPEIKGQSLCLGSNEAKATLCGLLQTVNVWVIGQPCFLGRGRKLGRLAVVKKGRWRIIGPQEMNII